MTFVEVAVTSVGKGSSAVGGRSFETAVTFIGKGSLAAGGRSFETARARARVANDVKGVDERDRRL